MKIVYFILFMVLLSIVLIYLLYFPMMSENWDFELLAKGIPSGHAVVDTVGKQTVPNDSVGISIPDSVLSPSVVDSAWVSEMLAVREQLQNDLVDAMSQLADAEAELADRPEAVDTTTQKVVAKTVMAGKPITWSPEIPVEDLALTVHNHSGQSLQVKSGEELVAEIDSVGTFRVPIGAKILTMFYGEKSETVKVQPNQKPQVEVLSMYYDQSVHSGWVTVAKVKVRDDNPVSDINFESFADSLCKVTKIDSLEWTVASNGKLDIKGNTYYPFSFSIADNCHKPEVYKGTFLIIRKARSFWDWLFG